MKYKQICPECCYEKIINNISEALKECPGCGGSAIGWYKPEVIEESEEAEYKENVNEIIAATESDEISWDNIIEDLGISELQNYGIVKLKYISGVINIDFIIEADVNNKSCIFGRSGIGAEYFCKDERVSNEHFKLIGNNEKIYIVDISRNGTTLNGVRLEKNKEHEINNGDIIKLGKSNDGVMLKVIIDAIR